VPRRRPRYSGTHPRRFEEKYKEHRAADFPEHTEHLRGKGRTPASTHVPVMVAEVLEHLDPKPGETIVDCTLGFGGHARAILARIAAGRLIALDVDGAELAKTVARLQPEFGDSLCAHRMRFAGIAKALALEGVGTVDGILADLGVSSMQLDDPARGFSVKRDGPLDLRMDDRLKRTGADVVNELDEAELAAALRELADEEDAEAIAREIAARRRRRPIARTSELVEAVLAAKGATSPADATRTFQALRMLVNDEPGNLRELLRVAPSCLAPGGRIVVISFHSGEDRLVKESFRAGARVGDYASIASDPLRPSSEEVAANPRASPARLRFAVRARHDV
jgi:16S rRNA (cytosine1402-N4)-methyltransferase